MSGGAQPRDRCPVCGKPNGQCRDEWLRSAVTVSSLEDEDLWIADRRLWLNADRTKIVEDGDPEARFLFASGPGRQVAQAEAEKYGLIGRPQRTTLSPEHVFEEQFKQEDSALTEDTFQTAGDPNQPAAPGPQVSDKSIKGPPIRQAPKEHGDKR